MSTSVVWTDTDGFQCTIVSDFIAYCVCNIYYLITLKWLKEETKWY